MIAASTMDSTQIVFSPFTSGAENHVGLRNEQGDQMSL
jgi:hypothetical protein